MIPEWKHEMIFLHPGRFDLEFHDMEAESLEAKG